MKYCLVMAIHLNLTKAIDEEDQMAAFKDEKNGSAVGKILKRVAVCISGALAAFLILAAAPISSLAEPDFLEQQKKFPRVRKALQNKSDVIERHLAARGLKSADLNILIVAYKSEAVLDIYAKKPDEGSYSKLISYPFCYASGNLGPKRRKGDNQVPEGFYRINRFNPVSSFHLSLGIDYPNASDRLKTRADPGGDIFIHGACVSIGCIAMSDPVIEEIYLYAVYARKSGQKTIPVYIFPFRMTRENMEKHEAVYRKQPELLGFWRNIKEGYDKFIENGSALKVSVSQKGDYIFGP
ncbi:MAG: L,D-transpeptidase family protein [Syntrophorhabdaceae bacterium]|nr:L,D-transpeptidase family protein [Syntrophorhabdaceae bacterium]